MGTKIEAPAINAAVPLNDMEIFVDLDGLIDKAAERKRLEKEKSKVEGGMKGKRAKLANEKFTSSAPPEIVEREKVGLAQLEEQLKMIDEALAKLG